VNCIFNSVNSILCSNRVSIVDFRHAWVIRPTNPSETLNSFVLPDFHCQTRSSCHMLSNLLKLRQNILINLKKLLTLQPIQMKHFQSRNLIPLLQNPLYNLPHIPLLNNMWLYHTTSAVLEIGSCLDI